MFIVIAFSLLAAFLIAVSAVLQQRATRDVAAAERVSRANSDHGVAAFLPVVRILRPLVRDPVWLLGWLANTVGFFVQAVALHYGSVAVVQPLLVTQLLFTLALVSTWQHTVPRGRDLLAGLAICGGVAIFLSVRGAAPDDGSADRGSVILAGLAALGLVAVLVRAGYGQRAVVHTACIGTASGLCFALSAVLTKLTTADLLNRGIAATAVDWVGYGLAAATAIGLVLEQQAFGVGPLPIAVAAMAIVNPIVSYIIGILAFDIRLNTDVGALAAVSASGLLLVVGAIGLAHSPVVRRDAIEVSS